jgi:hypothetical protein
MDARRTVTVGDYKTGPREREYVNQVLDGGRVEVCKPGGARRTG